MIVECKNGYLIYSNMRYLKLFESYSDIKTICNKLGIANWIQNLDGGIDVNGNVNLREEKLEKLPIKFGKINGHFLCEKNQLTTLEGAPREVSGHFWCYNNKLTKLEGAPIYVGGIFDCQYNKLTNLEGSPEFVGGDFVCSDNKLITLDGAPKEMGRDFVCLNNPISQIYELFPDYKSFMDSLDYGYLRGTNVVKSRLQEALDEVGIEMPESIIGYNWV
jgi:hypothetical protein